MKLTPMIPEGKRKPDGYMLSVTTEEAHKLISSLALQMFHESSNTGRTEFYTDDGLYLSVAVNFEEERKEYHLKMDAYSKMLKKKFEEGGWLAANDEVHGTNLKEEHDKTDNKRRKRSKTKV